MEALYKKLYDKYTTLKTKKESEMDKLNHDQEMKFLKYVTAADELVEHLRNENGRLHEQIDNIRTEAVSIRSTKDVQNAEYEKLLMEEKQKNKQLSETIERLRYLDGLSCSAREGNTESGHLNMSESSQDGSGILNDSHVNVTRKRSRHYGTAADIRVTPYAGDKLEHAATGMESASDLSKKTVSSGNDLTVDEPECCRRKIYLSGGGTNVTGPANCMFHDLIECLLSMKLSPVPQHDGKCISAVHQSSGYSFSLTLATNKAGEAELLYRVLSLGTFEKVAPEWMKEEVLRFSTRMCAIFFQRVSHIITRHG